MNAMSAHRENLDIMSLDYSFSILMFVIQYIIQHHTICIAYHISLLLFYYIYLFSI